MRTYTPSGVWSTALSLAEDAVDDDNAAAFNSPIEALADNCQFIGEYLDAKLVLVEVDFETDGSYPATPAATILPNKNKLLYFRTLTAVDGFASGNVVEVSCNVDFAWTTAPDVGTLGDHPIAITINDGTNHTNTRSGYAADENPHSLTISYKWTISAVPATIGLIFENSDATQSVDVLKWEATLHVWRGLALSP